MKLFEFLTCPCGLIFNIERDEHSNIVLECRSCGMSYIYNSDVCITISTSPDRTIIPLNKGGQDES